MAKKQPKREPGDCVHDTYRRQNAGVVDISNNTKAGTSDYYVDREQLQDDLTFDGKKFVETKTDILRNARRNMGGLKFPSSNKRR